MNLPPTMVRGRRLCRRESLDTRGAGGRQPADVVSANMRAMPVNDFSHDNVPLRANSHVLDPIHVWRVKPSAKARHRWDFYEPVATITGEDAFMPLEETGCKLARS